MNKQPDCRECGTGNGLCPQHVMMKEKVNHPAHYGGDTTYEHIKVVEAWGLNYALGSATKYICRAGKKNLGFTGRAELNIIKDLEKARFWIEHEIKRLEDRLDHPFLHGLSITIAGRAGILCAHETSPGVYCGLPPSKHSLVTTPLELRREATCEELDCDDRGHSPYCSKEPRRSR